MAPQCTPTSVSRDGRSLDTLFSAIDPAAATRCGWMQTPGLNVIDGYRASLQLDGQRAEVRLEPSEILAVRLPTSLPLPIAALAINSELPANVRLARNRAGGQLLADVVIGDADRMEFAMQEIRRGFRMATHGAGRASFPHDPRDRADRQQVRAVLDQMNWGQDSIVDHPAGWELRPRVAGAVYPVNLTVWGTADLRLHRTVCAGVARGVHSAGCRLC